MASNEPASEKSVREVLTSLADGLCPYCKSEIVLDDYIPKVVYACTGKHCIQPETTFTLCASALLIIAELRDGADPDWLFGK